jgi:hypothetical protein
MEELLNEQTEQVRDKEITDANVQTSPFIRKMNYSKNANDQLFVLQQFLEKITITDPKTFYTNLSKIALNKINPQNQPKANPAQQKANAQAPTQVPAVKQK